MNSKNCFWPNPAKIVLNWTTGCSWLKYFSLPNPAQFPFSIFLSRILWQLCHTALHQQLYPSPSPFLVGRLLRKISKLSQTASERKFKCYLRSFPLVKSFYFLSIFPKALLINSRKFNLILYNILGRKCSMEKLLNPKTSLGAVKKYYLL